MEKVKTKVLSLAKIKANQNNPRTISESKLKKLINSLLVFPKMMSLRPITIDENGYVLGGNMRLTALGRIAQMQWEELQSLIESLPEFVELPDGGKEVLDFWEKFLSKPQIEVQQATQALTESEKKQFIIKDNVSFGDWDYDELENWDAAQLESWGVENQLPDFGGAENFDTTDGTGNGGGKKLTETERLSEVKFVDCYYTPKEIPNITLQDCVDLDLFNKKVDFINSSSLPDEMKEIMKLLAYRFIKIDFESIANYYAFNASDEEKKVIERLRCVLVDGSLDGFFEDRMLRINEHFNE